MRDYGTAEWVGGDPNCVHTVGSGDNDNLSLSATRPERNGQKRQFCQKCGAVRVDKQIGLEQTLYDYINNLVLVFREVRRVLRDDGTVWLNLGDSYNGSGGSGGDYGLGGRKEGQPKYPGRNIKEFKPKDLMLVPHRVAIALQDDGWWVRQNIVWAKGCSFNYKGGSVSPESARDRPTTSHEYVFLLSKSKKYYYDYDAVLEDALYDGRKDTVFKGSKKHDLCDGQKPSRSKGERWSNVKDDKKKRNLRSVWVINPSSYPGAHYATFPTSLVEPCILAGCPENGIVLDPFVGSGTTLLVAENLGRGSIGIDLNYDYLSSEARNRLLYGDYVHVSGGAKQLVLSN